MIEVVTIQWSLRIGTQLQSILYKQNQVVAQPDWSTPVAHGLRTPSRVTDQLRTGEAILPRAADRRICSPMNPAPTAARRRPGRRRSSE
jgi:hypothetical protein